MKVISVNISEKKGTVKRPVDKIIIDDKGIINDAHYNTKQRQLSILGIENINKFEEIHNKKFGLGDFAENLTTEGLNLAGLKLLDRLLIKGVLLEVSQIGKKCHGDRCNIFKETGDCVMPKEGIFCRVIKSGEIKKDDEIKLMPKIFMVYLLTLSDRASQGEYTDRSGEKIKEMLKEYFNDLKYDFEIKYDLIPDDKDILKEKISKASLHADIIITTGGTGIGSRDITPEVIKPMLDKEIPGIMDNIRLKYAETNPNSLLSRSIAGTIDKTVVYTLPGSVKAVEEYLSEIKKTLLHIIYTLNDLDLHH